MSFSAALLPRRRNTALGKGALAVYLGEMRLLKRRIAKDIQRPAARGFFSSPLRPAEPFCVIGDIHGRADLLAELADRIAQTLPEMKVVCVGDYVDRGDDSAAVLRDLHVESRREGSPLVCLAGNHEAMLLEFLDRPEESGARWLRYGGLQTLSSYGLREIGLSMRPERLSAARDELRAALPDGMEGWLRSLPLHWSSGNVAVVHAGAAPSLPIDGQDPNNLLWGHPEFETRERTDGTWVVHGHTVVEAPRMAGGRIAIDTGAYATGILTAAAFLPDAAMPQFLSTARGR